MGDENGANGLEPQKQTNPFKAGAGARRRKIQHAPKVRFDHRMLTILRGGYITNPHEPDLADYAEELADQSDRPIEECLKYLTMLAKNEMWPARRKRYWQMLEDRALEREARRNLTIYERRMLQMSEDMLDTAHSALLTIPVTTIPEVVLLAKLGMEMGYRAHRAPHAVRDFYGDDGEIVKPPIEATFQDMGPGEYEAATASDIAELTGAVGPGPAPGGDHA